MIFTKHEIKQTFLDFIKSNSSILIIIIISLVIKIIFLISTYLNDPSGIMRPDSPTYEDPALTLLENGKFSFLLSEPDTPMFLRTPGYPVFISIIYLLFGANRWIVILFQVLLSSISIWLLYCLLKKIGSKSIGIFAGILLALDITQYHNALMLLSDTLFSFLIMCILYSGFKLITAPEHKNKHAVYLGLSLAFATLVRPISYYLPVIILLILLLFKNSYSIDSRKSLCFIFLLVILPSLLFIGSWQLRNKIVVGTYEYSGIKALNLLFYRSADVVAIKENISFEEAQEKLKKKYLQDNLTQVERDNLYKKEGIKILLDNPYELALSVLYGIRNTIIPESSKDFLKQTGFETTSFDPVKDLFQTEINAYFSRWTALKYLPQFIIYFFTIFYYSFIYLTVIFNNYLSYIKNINEKINVFHIYAFCIFFYFLLIGAGPEAYSRFRLPLMPILILYSCLGFRNIKTFIKRRYAAA